MCARMHACARVDTHRVCGVQVGTGVHQQLHRLLAAALARAVQHGAASLVGGEQVRARVLRARKKERSTPVSRRALRGPSVNEVRARVLRATHGRAESCARCSPRRPTLGLLSHRALPKAGVATGCPACSCGAHLQSSQHHGGVGRAQAHGHVGGRVALAVGQMHVCAGA
jgi:hypothetical protein